MRIFREYCSYVTPDPFAELLDPRITQVRKSLPEIAFDLDCAPQMRPEKSEQSASSG
jgi:hypothetical protein